ncbi:EpsG family protein [Lactiplantibacillus plantarum]|nr:EpsG family protein [Lactiplantibacillus plantarum]
MLVGLYIFFLFFCMLSYRKSLILFIVALSILWIFLAGTYGNADEPVYLSRYTSPELWQGQTEVLYSFFMSTCRKLGLDFNGFKMVNAFLQLGILSIPIWKRAKHPNIVLLCYSVFPFAMDVTQLRNGLATSVMLFSLDYLFPDEHSSSNNLLDKNDIKFLIGILVATMIHTASAFWIIFLMGKKLQDRGVVFFTISFSILFSTLIRPRLISWLVSFFGASARIDAYLSAQYDSTRALMMTNSLTRIAIFAILTFAILILLRHFRVEKSSDLDFALKINVLALNTIPFVINYTPEMYRMQIGIAVLNYIVITNNWSPSVVKRYTSRLQMPINNFVISVGLILLTLTSIYLLGIRAGNFSTVVEPLFTKNIFFGI